jgi:hypothetical protein
METSLIEIGIGITGFVLSTAIGGLVVWFWRSVDARKKLAERVDELEKQIGIVNAQVIPISTAFQAILVKQLTHYHTPKMDALLAKLGGPGEPTTITNSEEAELLVELKKRTRDMGPEISDDERDAAEMLPVIIRRVKREAERVANGETTFTDIQMVGSVHVPEEGEKK